MQAGSDVSNSLSGTELIDMVYQCSTDTSKWPELTMMLENIDLDNPTISKHLDRAGTILDALSRATRRKRAPSPLQHLPIGIAQVHSDMSITPENPAFTSIAQANPHYFSVSRSRIRICDRKLADSIREHRNHSDANQHTTFMLESNIPTSIMIQTNDSGDCTLLVSSQNATDRIHSSSLKQLFGLTPSESRLVKQLCSGATSIREAATLTGITANTARSQLKIIYQKVGVNSQVDLVRRVLTSVAVLRDNEPLLPVNTIHTIFLEDGRKLEYSEYGDPNGFPVINFHSTGQSCQSFHPRLEQLKGTGIRLITPSRPGIGHSSRCDEFSHLDVARDISSLLIHLKIKKCSLLAFAGGGSFALAFAHEYPEKVHQVAIASCVLPHGFGDNAGKLSVRRIMLKLARSAPSIHRHLMRVILRNIEKNPEQYIQNQRKLAAEVDQHITTPEMLASVIDSFYHAVSTTLHGTIRDYRLSSLDWEFKPSEIQVPVTFWHGASNNVIKASNVEAFAKTIPTASYHQVDGGYLIYYSHFEQILESIRQQSS